MFSNVSKYCKQNNTVIQLKLGGLFQDNKRRKEEISGQNNTYSKGINENIYRLMAISLLVIGVVRT